MASSAASGFTAPSGACDCHVHVFPDPLHYPFAAGRRYTPPPASPDALRALLDGLGLQRVVVVQPSVYGSDNAATLAGIRALGPQRARGVAVIEAGTTDAALQNLHAAGVRGVRVNLELAGEADPKRAAQQLQEAAARVAPLGWHVQIYAQLPLLAALHATLQALPVPVVLDHFGGAVAAGGVHQPGFDRLLDLVGSGRVYVKLSAAYRCSAQAPAFPDMAPLAQALIAAQPERMLWGSDWPHPDPARPPGSRFDDVRPPLAVDDGHLLAQLPHWAGNAATLHRILVDNPARLYDF